MTTSPTAWIASAIAEQPAVVAYAPRDLGRFAVVGHLAGDAHENVRLTVERLRLKGYTVFSQTGRLL